MNKLKKYLTVSMFVLMSLAWHTKARAKDVRTFDNGSTVKVWLNHKSFTDRDFPKSFNTRANLERAIIATIENWVQITGMDIKVYYAGNDNKKFEAGKREILIRALTRKKRTEQQIEDNEEPLRVLADATRGQGLNNSNIRFFRKSEEGEKWGWEVFATDDNSVTSFISVLTHELGHSFGLDHNNDSAVRTVMRETAPFLPYGPMKEDIEDILDEYQTRDKVDVNVKRSTDNGNTWSTLSSDIGNGPTTSTLPLSVVRDKDRMIAFVTRPDKKPVWTIGDSGGKRWKNGTVFGGERSIYGTVGHGNNDEYMMAWVDHSNVKGNALGNNQIRIVRSSNGGRKWHNRNPPSGTQASGTPAVHKISSNTWILVYPSLDLRNFNQSGRIKYRISTNDGSSWSKEQELKANGETHRAIRGVAVTSDGPNKIWISFAHATNKLHKKRSRASSLVTIHARLKGKSLVNDGSSWDTKILATSDATLTKSSKRFFMGYKRVNGGKLVVRNTSPDSIWWAAKTTPVNSRRRVGPAMAARPSSNFVYMFNLD